MKIPDLIKQKPYEKLEYILRRHPITFVPYIIFFSVLLAAPFILYFLANPLFSNFLNQPKIVPAILLFISAYLLAILVFFFGQFVDYYLDIWIITNDRLVDIEQFGLFSRSISEVDLFQIQDVTAEVHGAFATLFDYGNVTLQTASSNTGLVLRNVKNPNEIRAKLVELSDQDRKYHSSITNVNPTPKPLN